MEIIDGKAISEAIKNEIKAEVEAIIDAGKRPPHMVAVIVGNDGASETYVASKEKNCKSVGMTSSVYRLEENISEAELLKTVDFLNKDPEVDGFIVQLPLPKHIDENKIISAIYPSKDIDGFHPNNLGKLVLGHDTLIPATPKGITELILRSGIETKGKKCVVLGRSHIVGTPMALLMSRNADFGNATVTLCHTKTENIKEVCLEADIIIAAVGKPHFLKADMVKKGAVVIDVGVHRIEDKTKQSGFRLVGDVDFEAVSKIASKISPVPGGVGPMTIAALLQNTMKAYKNNTLEK